MISFDFVDDQIFDWVDPNGPGCSVGIYQEGEVVFANGYGLANIEHKISNKPETVFHIASISKQFTAMAIGLLAEDGLLDIDSQLIKFFPDLQVGHQVSLRQIIYHTSGLRDQWGLLDLAGWRHEDIKTNHDIIQLTKRQRFLNFASGSRFQYINTGYTLLGEIVEQITGQTLRDFTQSRIFTPLGMTRTHFHDDYNEIIVNRADAYNVDDTSTDDRALKINIPAYETVGPTGLYSSVADFVMWERNFLNPIICSSSLVNEMCASGCLADGTPTGYGFGLAISDHRGLPVIEHAGGDAAFRSHFLRFPSERFAITVFCNSPDRSPGQITKSIADHVLADRLSNRLTSASSTAAMSSRATGIRAPATETLLPFCGAYHEVGGHDEVDLIYRNGTFILASQDGTEYELSPIGSTSFAFLGMDATCQIEEVEGAPLRLRTFYGGTETALLEAVEKTAQDSFVFVAEELIGKYTSDELDTYYRVVSDGELLFLNRGKKGTHELQLIKADRFICKGGLVIQFERDAQRVTGMLVSIERVWNISLQKC